MCMCEWEHMDELEREKTQNINSLFQLIKTSKNTV